MEIKVKALCVRSIDYRDNDNLITLATFSKGKILATVRGSKKQNSKLRFSASIFCFGEYILNVSKTGRYSVIGCDLIDSFIPLREDIEKFYLASITLEVLEKNLVTPNDKLILQTIKTLKEISYQEKDKLDATIEYLYLALLYSGYGFPSVECKICGKKNELYFDETTLDFVCLSHKVHKSVLLKESVVNGLRYIYQNEFDKLKDIDETSKQNILYLLVMYFELTADIKLKTYKSYFDIIKDLSKNLD